MKFENYCLDLNKVNSLKKDKRRVVIEMYRDMLFSGKDGSTEIASSFFNTLNQSGYLINIRERKINDIVHGVQDDNN